MITKTEIEEKWKTQLACEFNCLPQDFDKSENVITTACQQPQRRQFSDKPFFLQMSTFGKGTVISADESIHPWLTDWVKGKQGIWLFEQHNYFLCKAVSFGDKHLTKDEIEDFHLSTLKLKYEEALAEYEKCSCTKLGRLVANREVPILKKAKEVLDIMKL